ncbi:MAG: 4Fe-4S binding protein, partial [Fibrobacter sp.]|nr:4Fe-4S binding protein [Fibrobacter sp.]
MGIKVDLEKCIGCSLCVRACAQSAIQIVNKKAVIDMDKCNLCSACVEACKKYMAITISKDNAGTGVDLSLYKNVAVFVEQHNGEISGVSFEMLGEGRKLADQLGEKLLAIVLGHDMHKKADELVKFGADKVYYVDGANLVNFQ